MRDRADTLALREAAATAPAGGPAAVDDATVTISQLAPALGVHPQTLRGWEEVGLLAPRRVIGRGVATRTTKLATSMPPSTRLAFEHRLDAATARMVALLEAGPGLTMIASPTPQPARSPG